MKSTAKYITWLKTGIFMMLNSWKVSLLKPSQNHPTLLRRLPTVNEIKQQKKKDVEQILIKQFGEEWSENAELEWFKTNIFSASAANTGAHNDGDDVDENYQECDCCEPDMQNFI